MIWSRRPSTRSAAPPKRDASATAKSSAPTSKKRSGSEPENPGWTLSKPGAISHFATEKQEKGCFGGLISFAISHHPVCACVLFAKCRCRRVLETKRGIHEDRQRRPEI